MISLVIPWETALPGGVSVVVRQLHAAWQRAGVPAQVLIDQWPQGKSSFSDLGVATSFFLLATQQGTLALLKSMLRAPGRLWGVSRQLKRHKVTALNFHYASTNALAPALLKLLGLYKGALVLSFHGTDVRAPQGILELLAWRLIFRACDAVTFCSDALRQTALNILPLPTHKAVVLYNGVDTSLFRPVPGRLAAAPLHLTSINTLADYVISVGSYIPRKDHRVLLMAVAQLPAQYANLRVTVVGAHGPELPKLIQLSEALGLSARTRFLCDLSPVAVAEVVAQARLCVQPAQAEPFGLAVIEAAACEVPVIATDVGGHCEIIQHGLTGWLFPVGDVAACARAIQEALVFPEDAKARAQVLAAQVRKRFTWDGLAEGLLHLMKGHTTTSSDKHEAR